MGIGTSLTRRFGLRLAVGVAAFLALAGATLDGVEAASARAESSPGVKFIVRYQGTLTGTWRNSTPVQVPDPYNTFRCKGHDSSGSLTSTVRSGKPFLVRVEREFGRGLPNFAFGPNGGMDKAVVSSNRTAQAWLMRYSNRECKRFDTPQPGCGAHTFLGHVTPLTTVTGNFGGGPVHRIFLAWEREPETIGCDDGIFYPLDMNYGFEAAAINLKQLYRCGMRKPRRCRMTIGRARSFDFNKTSGDTTYSSSMQIAWSLTFVAAGKGQLPRR